MRITTRSQNVLNNKTLGKWPKLLGLLYYCYSGQEFSVYRVIAFSMAESRTIRSQHNVCGVDFGLPMNRLCVLINTTYSELLLRVNYIIVYHIIDRKFKKGMENFCFL